MKKLICLALSCAMLLTGCSRSEPEVPEETTSSSEQTRESTELSLISLYSPYGDNLLDMPQDVIDKFELCLEHDKSVIYNGMIRRGDIISNNQFEFDPSDYKFLRQSSGALFVESIDGNLYKIGIDDNINAIEFTNVESFKTAYDIIYDKAVVTLTHDFELENAAYSYTIKELSVNCFVNNAGNGNLELIIDPAYMQGIPILSDETGSYIFNVADSSIKGDTFSIIAKCPNSIDFTSSCYARVDFDLFYKYSLKEGDNSTAIINGFELLTEDVSGVLNGNYSMAEGNEKDPAMTATYNALNNNLKELKKDSTAGVVLVDLDFNGTPEVIVSNFLNHDEDDGAYINADIYRIEDEELIYVDTLYNYYNDFLTLGNIIGIKTLEDGSKAWFQMSYIDRSNGEYSSIYSKDAKTDVSYLFTFNGKELNFTDAIRIDNIENPINPDIDMDIYVMGEKQQVTVKYGYDPYYDPEDEYFADAKLDFPYLSCNNIVDAPGKHRLITHIKENFCQDIIDSYYLNSDWSFSNHQIAFTERMLSYYIANLVDSYYLGEYSPYIKGYSYTFSGNFAKPVIYLYPENETKVDVSIDFKDKDGKITCSYPEYKNGWTVTAEPDGTLYDKNGDENYCLYWEGEGSANLDISKGFCVKGSDTATFLREKLLAMGLTAREANEMIIYWLPLMQSNNYNIISLHTNDYADAVALNVSPKPDSVIRVFMTFYASDKPIEIAPQILPEYSRSGFTVVEWGGSEITLD